MKKLVHFLHFKLKYLKFTKIKNQNKRVFS